MDLKEYANMDSKDACQNDCNKLIAIDLPSLANSVKVAAKAVDREGSKTGKKISKEKAKAIMDAASEQLRGRYHDIYEAFGAEKSSHGPNHHCFNEAGHAGGFDRKPSMGIDNETGTYNCFACGLKGNLLTYWKEYVQQGPDDQYHEFLLHDLGVQWVDVDKDEESDMAKQSNDVYAAFANKFKKGSGKTIRPKDTDEKYMKMEELKPYVDRLLANEGAMAYLKRERNITEEVIRKYNIGLTAPKKSKDGSYTIKNSKCFTFPVISPDSQLCNLKLYNPLTKDDRFKWTYLHRGRKMWPSPVSSFANDRLYFFEGEPDAYCATGFGIAGAVTLGAAKASNPLAMLGDDLAKKYISGKQIVICLDADSAGQKAAEILAKAVLPMASQVKIINFDKSDINPWGLDPDNTYEIEEAGKKKQKRKEKDFTDFMRKNGFGTEALDRFHDLVEATEAYTPNDSVPEETLCSEDIPAYVAQSDFMNYNDQGYFYISLDGKVVCNLHRILTFLKSVGYCKVYLGNESIKSSLVKVVEPNVIKISSLENSKDDITKALTALPENVTYCTKNEDPDKCEDNYYCTATIAKHFIAAKVVSILNSYAKYDQLPEFIGKELSDTKDTSYIPFTNGVLAIKKDTIDLLSYKEIDGFVWQRNVIEHAIQLEGDGYTGMFETFVSRATAVGRDDDRNKRCLENNIGYNIYRYKCATVNKISIYSDYGISSTIEGRRGKSLVFVGISKIRNISTIDGKSFSPTRNNFIFQNVTPETDLILIDDARSDLDIEYFFAKATGDLTVEKKGEPAFVIPRDKSPKFAITTNNAVISTGGSAEARMTNVEFGTHYSVKFSPEDDFGCLFYDDWSSSEWNRFYLYMIRCLQQYLSEGFIEIKSNNAALKQLIATSSEEFFDWMESEVVSSSPGLFEGGVMTKTMRDKYCRFEDIDYRKITTAKFGKWMAAYANYKGWKRESISHLKIKDKDSNVIESGRGFRFIK